MTPWVIKPNGEEILKRVEIHCARNWMEARQDGMAALAANNSARYIILRHEEQEWFSAMLVVNRLILGIEPLVGATFLPESENPR